MNNPPQAKNLTDFQYEVLGHKPEQFTEIRDLATGKQVFAKGNYPYYIGVIDYINNKEDIYVGINPRTSQSGLSKDVAYVSCLVIDIDPIRPVDTPSTDSQLDDAIRTATLIGREYPNSVIVSSGSGAHVYIPIIPEPVRQDTQERIKAWGKYIVANYSIVGLKIDNIFDLPRIIRVWGSWNTKSNRRCGPISYIPTAVLPGRVTFDSIVPQIKGLDVAAITPLKVPLLDKIPNGMRNQTLVSLAGTMKKRNFSQAAILTALLAENIAKCNPPLPESEVKSIVNSIGRYSSQSVDNIKTISEDYFTDLDKRQPGIATGFSKLDGMMAGLKNGRLYVIAARPSEGKTTYLTQLTYNIAKSGLKTLLFSTEVGASAIYDKIVARNSRVELRKFQFGNFTPDERLAINSVKEELKKLPFYVHENFALETSEIDKKIAEIKPEVVVIDYLQDLRFPEGGKPQELSKAMRDIKSYVDKYQIPIILASQLNRPAEGMKASLGQLKGSGAIEEKADMVAYLYLLDKTAYPRPIVLDIMKSKYGETGQIHYDFFSRVCDFREK